MRLLRYEDGTQTGTMAEEGEGQDGIYAATVGRGTTTCRSSRVGKMVLLDGRDYRMTEATMET